MKFKKFLEASCDKFLGFVKTELPDVWDNVGGDQGEPDTSNKICQLFNQLGDKFLTYKALKQKFGDRPIKPRNGLGIYRGINSGIHKVL